MESQAYTREQRLAARARVITKFAVLDPDTGRAQRCTEARGEWSTDDESGKHSKVIFPSQAFANRTAGAFAAIGEDPQEAYYTPDCGHWHLRDAGKRRAREQAYTDKTHRSAITGVPRG